MTDPKDNLRADRLAVEIQAMAEHFRGANGGIYTIRAMSLELAALLAPRLNEAGSPPEHSPISEIHSALSKADIEYSGYSCNGVNLIGDRASIKAACSAFHSHGQIDHLKTQIRHWREECGKLHAKLDSPPPVKGLSGDHEDERVLKLHLNRKVTDADRKWVLDAINAWFPSASPLQGDAA